MTDTGKLDEAQLADSVIPSGADPYALFDEWFADAQNSELNDPNAMALATADADGMPSVRMVLLKGHGAQESGARNKGAGEKGAGEKGAREKGTGGFTFFTNSESRKGGEILANSRASLLFHWKSLRRQIRIEGPLEEVTPERADEYFHSRPYKSQVGSAASDQSRPMETRQDYLDRVTEIWAKYEQDGQVPRPPHWTGFTLRPMRIEFWIDRDNRLHDRRQFTRTRGGTGWIDTLLYP